MAHSAGEVTSRGLLEHCIYHCSVRIDLHHREPVNREMGEMERPPEVFGQKITFLFRHQAVHQASNLGMSRWHPRHAGGARCCCKVLSNSMKSQTAKQ